MTVIRMHADEIETDERLVRRLLAAQFPQWADLPIERVASAGTDNALYRLGEMLVVRLPRIHWAVGQVEKERAWLPKLAPHLPLAVPEPIAMGEPGEGYPWRWGVYRWLAGEIARLDRLADPCESARELAAFVLALQRLDPAGGPAAVEHNLRGAPLATRDEGTREAIRSLAGMYDADALMDVWDSAVRAPGWRHEPVWFHGDLLPGNVLIDRGQVTAVIDFSGLGVGDPACDLMIAWSLFTGESRAAFREATGVEEATWLRGRGCALSQAAHFIPYYVETNPAGVAIARRAIEEILMEATGER
jgi:aminoglycoside phosphotransferase (APT) family kinase protein